MAKANQGKVYRVMGPVVDVLFEEGNLQVSANGTMSTSVKPPIQ